MRKEDSLIVSDIRCESSGYKKPPALVQKCNLHCSIRYLRLICPSNDLGIMFPLLKIKSTSSPMFYSFQLNNNKFAYCERPVVSDGRFWIRVSARLGVERATSSGESSA